MFNKLKAEINKSLKQTASSGRQEFGVVDYTIDTIPCIIEKKRDPWVHYGEDNLYPLRVADLRNGSSIHNSILKTKTKMTAGNGFLLNGAINQEDSKVKIESLTNKSDWDFFFKNIYGGEDLNSLNSKLADDLQTHGDVYAEAIFNTDFTKIVGLKYINAENIRAGKLVNNKVESYWYSRDWSQANRTEFKPREIKAFDLNNKTAMNQIIHEKLGKNDYYGELPYKGCLTWVMIDFKMGLFHLSNIDNGMNPGIWFKFYKLPKNESAKQDILDELKKKYQGAVKTNKMVVTFSDGKDLAPDIMPIQSSNLDKMLLNLAELCDKKILTGHQLTSPLLAGISVSGQIGGNTELKTAYQIYDNSIIESDRKVLERIYARAIEFNKYGWQLEIEPFDPFKVRPTTTIQQ